MLGGNLSVAPTWRALRAGDADQSQAGPVGIAKVEHRFTEAFSKRSWVTPFSTNGATNNRGRLAAL